MYSLQRGGHILVIKYIDINGYFRSISDLGDVLNIEMVNVSFWCYWGSWLVVPFP